ncbi:F-box protein At5g07610-like [Rutidosis leptorrhynchoides]|uniref:F-box protein At5g07610-like n=1 Tax=Rutidosis leptorrhynchoides TaxID=125765 RepID=UPI003A9A5980
MKTNIKKYRKFKQQIDQNSATDLASNADVLTEILFRLPIRSLLRSKCVSKDWRSLISDHSFALRRNPNPNPPCGLFLQRVRTSNIDPFVFEYDFVSFNVENEINPPFEQVSFNDSESLVLHSCKGLMLCHSLSEYYCNVSKEIVYNPQYYVYNPTINRFETLPKLEGGDGIPRRPRGMTLVYDPLKSHYYQIVCVRAVSGNDDLYEIEIYSSKSKSWRKCGKPFANQIDTEFMCGVYWNDAVHWINTKGFLVYLKIGEDHLDNIRLPVEPNARNIKKHCYPLVEGRDCLLYMNIYSPPSLMLEIFEMRRDYSDWGVAFQIDLEPHPETTDSTILQLYLNKKFVIHCFVLGENKEDGPFLVIEVPGKIFRYSIDSNKYEELCELDEEFQMCRFTVADDGFSKLGRWPGAFMFYESLSHP